MAFRWMERQTLEWDHGYSREMWGQLQDTHLGITEPNATDTRTLRDLQSSFFPYGRCRSLAELQWLYPPRRQHTNQREDDDGIDGDTRERASPLDAAAQIHFLVHGLVRYQSYVCDHAAIEVLLASHAFESDALSPTQRQWVLDEAVYNASDEVTLNVLLAHGADPQAAVARPTKPHHSDQSSMFASLHGVDALEQYTVGVRTLVESGVFITGDTNGGRVMFCRRPDGGSVAFARDLVLAGADPAGVLSAAVQYGCMEVIRALVTDGMVDIATGLPPQKSEYGYSGGGKTALAQAILQRYSDSLWERPTRTHTVSTLLKLGANVNTRAGRFNETALHHAVKAANSKAVSWLLQRRADPNLCGKRGSPLHLAGHRMISRRNAACEKLLLQYGADANVRDPCGKTPLDVVLERPRFGVDAYQLARLLIAHGADVYLRNEVTDLSPLDILANARSRYPLWWENELWHHIQWLQGCYRRACGEE